MNDKHKDTLNSASDKCGKIRSTQDNSNAMVTEGSQLLSDSADILKTATDYFKKLGKTFENMKTIGQDMESDEYDLSAVVEDFRQRYLQPCMENANRLFGEAFRVQAMFENELGINADQTVRAASAYR